VKRMDGELFAIGFKKGTEVLLTHVDEINTLNVFPVPDGDTGSNMSSALLEACKHIEQLKKRDLTSVLQAIETGTLLGARGNSGVILSQIFRGFAQACKGKKSLNAHDFSQALKSAKEVAYGAVIKPVEGTMLTVIRVLAQESENLESDDLVEFMEKLWKRSQEVVEETPKLLKKLRDAGVVDSGAKGFSYIIEGFYRALNGDREVNLEIESAGPREIVRISQEELKYLYCTEAIVKLTKEIDLPNLKSFYNSLGDSLVLVNSGDYLKFHVHTNTPGKAIDKALEFGELVKLKVDNMKIQHHQIIKNEGESKDEKKKYGLVVVANGDGWESIFKSIGVDVVINGGQTSNPSTAQFKEAIESVNAQEIFVFPNNSNIILAAESVKEMVNGKKVTVIKTSTVQQGLAALFMFNPQASVLENLNRFKEAVESVKSLEITKAVRDSKIKNREIKEGEYIGFVDGNLVCSKKTLDESVFCTLDNASASSADIITLFYGKNVSESDARVIFKEIQIRYPSVDVEMYYGGQAHYYYLISVE